MDKIYLDYAATTPLEESVLNEMMPYFIENYGNPSSIHFLGQKAEYAVENARKRIQDLLFANDYQVIFTSGGTESDNLALRGCAFKERKRRNANTILISSVEHQAIDATAEQLRDVFGFTLSKLRVDTNGFIDLDYFYEHLSNDVALVSVIHGNNEIGTINPVDEINSLCKSRGIPFHSDCVQTVAHLDINLSQTPIDLISFGAHKFYGPKGIGALLVKKSTDLLPQITGGKQEFGIRAGTQNVPLIMGLVKALELRKANQIDESKRLLELRGLLINRVLNEIEGSHLTGDPINRLDNHASFIIDGVNGNQLVVALDVNGFAVSSGSACKVGNPKPSTVLLAMGYDEVSSTSSVRFTLGKYNNQNDIDQLIPVLKKIVSKMRKSYG